MYKVAVIGDYESIYGFGAVGFQVYPVLTKEEAITCLMHLVVDKYAIIYITESFVEQIQDVIKTYETATLPAIIPIPSVSGTTGVGMNRMRKLVERAVGSAILFEDHNKVGE